MTTAQLPHPSPIPDLDLSELPPRARRPLRWRVALRALRELMDDPEQTDKAFEILEAVGGTTDDGTFQRFAAEPEGRSLLREKPSLAAAMADRQALAAMPEGSFGRAYLDFAERNGFAADGLIELAEAAFGDERDALDPHHRWFYDRLNVMHDLWHVLTGCDTTPLGEGVLLAFARAQGVSNRGVLVLLAAAAVRGGPGVSRQLVRGYRRGRCAAPLLLERYETLLPLPLHVVRARLAIAPV